MVHPSPYGGAGVNPSRPPYPKGHSQSFTAGSNPNSAPMPTFSSQQHQRRQSQSAAPSRSYTPQPEPTFDLMSSAQPMFGDVNFQMPNLSFDLPGSMSMPPATSSFTTPGLSASSFPDDASFDDSTGSYLAAHGLAEYDPNAFAADFAAMNGADTSFSRPPVPSNNTSKINSPFTSTGPVLAPPASNRQGPTTDSIHKNQPQTPRKTFKARSVAVACNQPLLPAPASVKTPLAQRDSNAYGAKRAVPDSPNVDHTSPRKAHKRSKTDEPGRHRESVPIPDAEAFPPIDPGEDNAKPPYTYAQMIALAIWKAPNRRRTLSQIYDFIRTTWCYYRRDNTWENSIRHNLSLHKKYFDKQARAKDDPGKGNYWIIISGNERELLDVYVKERPVNESTMSCRNLGAASSARLEPSALPPMAKPGQEPMLPPRVPHHQLQFPAIPNLQPPAPVRPDLSSDATISASDQAFDETDFADGPPNFASLDAALTSSPPAISRRASAPSDTPTRTTRIGGSSGRTSGKRKRNSMVDSGYMTGLDSSIPRCGQRAPVFSSEADSDFQGGGRAEDAIRKMRASSSDSPSKGRTRMLPPSSPLGKGSPLRYRASPSMASAPLRTPANSKKQFAGAPSLPPPKTTSKYNNSPIRQHDKLRANVRSMLETPPCVRDYDKKYPGRRSHRGGDLDTFAIFEDNTSGPEMESPLPANSAGRMLDELMSAKRNQQTPLVASSPFKSFPLFPRGDENSSWAYDSPSKVFASSKILSSTKYLQDASKTSTQDSENWIITESMGPDIDLSNLVPHEDSAALDLTQTFRSIGERPDGVEAYGPATLHHYN